MMTDTQVITIVITILASIGALVYNNSRISDLRIDVGSRITDTGNRVDELRTDVNKRVDELRTDVNKRLDDVNRHIDDKFSLLMERLQRMEGNLTNQLANHESRLHKLEHPNEQ